MIIALCKSSTEALRVHHIHVWPYSARLHSALRNIFSGRPEELPISRCSGSFELKRMQVQLASAIYKLASAIYKLVLWKRCSIK
jgi:hypothetical protein